MIHLDQGLATGGPMQRAACAHTKWRLDELKKKNQKHVSSTTPDPF